MIFLKFIAKIFSYILKFYNFLRMLLRVIWYVIRAVWGRIKRHFVKNSKTQAQRALSNDYIYFVLKLAQVYSRNRDVVSVNRLYSMKEFCNDYNQKYCIVEKPHSVPVCCPKYYGVSDEKIENFDTKEIYIAEIHGATVFGASSVVTSEGQYIYDPVAFDTENRLDVKFSNYVANLNGKYYFENTNPNRSIDRAIFLMGFASYNYYHLTVEILSRMRYIDAHEEYDGLPILVDEIVGRVPQYRELLDKLNKKNRWIIYGEQGETIYVENLIYPSYNTWMPINVKNREDVKMEDFAMSESGLQNIRESIHLDNTQCDRKIFISREKVAASRLENEEQVRNLFAMHGFEIVHTENMSFEEQVKCFNSASCIVAASGAALTNLIYCQPETIVCCIIPREYKFFAYSTIAYMLGLRPVFLDAEVTERTPYPAMDLFRVKLDVCERFISEMIQK